MANGEDGSIEVDGQTTLLGIDEGLTRGIAQFGSQLGGTELLRGDS